MRVSTKGRYALRVMIVLAEKGQDNYIKLHEMAEQQRISEKYLEGILGTLVRAGLLEGARGKAGGYKLNCDPKKCSVWDILSLTETSVSPVACLDDNPNRCERAESCVTLPIWKELNSMIKDYLNNVKLEQFIRSSKKSKDKNRNCGF